MHQASRLSSSVWIGAIGLAFALVVGGLVRGQQDGAVVELTARIEQLIRQLDDDKFEVREKAQAALVEIGQPAIEKLTAALKDPSAERSQRAEKALSEIRKAGAELRYVSGVRHEGLMGAVTVALSPDGQFVYAPGFQASAINVFRRDPITGALEHQNTLADELQLGGVVTVRLSPDGERAIAACFSSQTVTLLSRDAKSGRLAIEASVRSDPAGGFSLQFPIDATFSTDGKFVYVADDRQAAVVAFRVVEGKRLEHVQTLVGEGQCFEGVRTVTPHPDGKTLYACSFRAGTLSVLERDPATGKLNVKQVVRDEQDGVHGLAGTMSACVSSDGKFVYNTSGRFDGDDAVSVFEIGADGKLKVIQEFINEQGELKDFTGGNELALSPDEKHFYAAGTTSCSLACFRRDAATGKLTYLTTVRNEATGDGVDLGANGIAMSSDGRFLYLALENVGGISVFERRLGP